MHLLIAVKLKVWVIWSKEKQQADYVFESEFLDGYKAHSPIEPHTALAHWEGEKVTVWASSNLPLEPRMILPKKWIWSWKM